MKNPRLESDGEILGMCVLCMGAGSVFTSLVSLIHPLGPAVVGLIIALFGMAIHSQAAAKRRQSGS